jgi:hypothetical protein
MNNRRQRQTVQRNSQGCNTGSNPVGSAIQSMAYIDIKGNSFDVGIWWE